MHVPRKTSPDLVINMTGGGLMGLPTEAVAG